MRESIQFVNWFVCQINLCWTTKHLLPHLAPNILSRICTFLVYTTVFGVRLIRSFEFLKTLLFFSLFLFSELTSEEQEFKGLEAHNIFRQIHQVPQMTLNGEMCKEAEDYAKILARKGSLEHSKETNDGENLAFSCSSDDKTQTVGDAVKNW